MGEVRLRRKDFPEKDGDVRPENQRQQRKDGRGDEQIAGLAGYGRNLLYPDITTIAHSGGCGKKIRHRRSERDSRPIKKECRHFTMYRPLGQTCRRLLLDGAGCILTAKNEKLLPTPERRNA